MPGASNPNLNLNVNAFLPPPAPAFNPPTLVTATSHNSSSNHGSAMKPNVNAVLQSAGSFPPPMPPPNQSAGMLPSANPAISAAAVSFAAVS